MKAVSVFRMWPTANAGVAKAAGLPQVQFLPNERMDALFEATVQATEEAIINVLVAARTTIGRDDRKVIGLIHLEAIRLRRLGVPYRRPGPDHRPLTSPAAILSRR